MNKTGELKAGIIGFGKMGKIRYETIKKLPGCKVAWICETNPNITVHDDVQHKNTPQDILEDDDVDFLVISTSNDMLQELVVAGLDRGKHVFCEKPPGRNMAELKAMIEAEARNPGLKLMYGLNHRHHESIIYTKKLIDSGEFGKLLWMRGRYGKSVDESFFSNWRAKKEIAGGGIFLDQGIHMLDLFLMMCGDFEEAAAYVSNLYWKLDIEDNVFAIFRNSNGQVASLHSTMTQWRHIFSLEIFLERGYFVLNGLKTSSNNYGDEILTIAKNRSLPPAASWSDDEKLIFHVDSSWEKEINIFVDAIRNNKEVSVGNTKDAFKLMTLVEKVYNRQ
jgi:predicted dehydrogenase